MFRDKWYRFFYRQDAFPVTRPTVSEHEDRQRKAQVNMDHIPAVLYMLYENIRLLDVYLLLPYIAHQAACLPAQCIQTNRCLLKHFVINSNFN